VGNQVGTAMVMSGAEGALIWHCVRTSRSTL
jgi:hypothetical protein